MLTLKCDVHICASLVDLSKLLLLWELTYAAVTLTYDNYYQSKFLNHDGTCHNTLYRITLLELLPFLLEEVKKLMAFHVMSVSVLCLFIEYFGIISRECF